MKVFAPSAFRYPAATGADYPYGLQDIGDDSLARTLLTAGLVVADDPGDQTSAAEKPLSPFTASQVMALKALVGGGSVNYAPLFAGTYGSVIFDAGVAGTVPVVRAVINAATDVIAATQITANSAQCVSSTITGASSTGEVLVISTGTVPITSLHMGFSTGTSQTLSGDTTITINELVNFAFDAADAVTLLRINLSPPRSSGRYIDCQVTGQNAS